MVASPHEPPAFAQLGAFALVGELGVGGSGNVYRARWGHRQVALKVLRADLLAQDADKKRFLAEAQRLSGLDHPGIVKVLGCGELPDGRPYLAMELLEGLTLGQRLQQGPLPLAAAVDLFGQLGRALAALHERGIIHRDVKADNVMLVEDGRYAVLLDFGIAKELAGPASTITQEGGVRGTPEYMAPERFFGESASIATDIYELAAVFFEMLAARLPWDAPTRPDSRLDPRGLAACGAQVPATLEALVRRALSTRVENRPASMAAFVAAVEQSLGVEPVVGGRRTADLAVGGGAGQAGAQPQVVGADLLAITLPEREQAVAAGEAWPAPAAVPRDESSVVVEGRASGGRGKSFGPAVHHDEPEDGPPPAGWAPPVTALDAPRTAASLAGVPVEPAAGQTTLRSPGRKRRAWLTAVATVGVFGAVVGAAFWWAGRGRATVTKVAAVEAVTPPPGAAVLRPLDTLPGDDPWAKEPPLPAPVEPSAPSDRRTLASAARLFSSEVRLIVGVAYRDLARDENFGPIVARVDAGGELFELLRASTAGCEGPLIDRLDWVVIGMAGGPDDVRFDLVVRGAWSRALVERCLAQLVEERGDAPKIWIDGQITRMISKTQELWLGWQDETTFMLTARDGIEVDWVRARLAGRGAAIDREPLASLANETDRSQTMWALGDLEAMSGVLIAGAPMARGVALSVELQPAARGRAVLVYEDERQAATVAGLLDDKLAALVKDQEAAALLGKIVSARDGQRVVIDAELSAFATATLSSFAGEALHEPTR